MHFYHFVKECDLVLLLYFFMWLNGGARIKKAISKFQYQKAVEKGES